MSKYNDTATYWSPATPNEYNEQTFGSPAAVTVRWEDKTESFLDKTTGKEEKSMSVVYLKTDVETDGFLFLGTSVAVDPKTVDGAFIIRNFENIRALRGSNRTRRAML